MKRQQRGRRSGAERSLWKNCAVGRPNDVRPGEMAKTREGSVKDLPLRGLMERLPEHGTNVTALKNNADTEPCLPLGC